MWYFKTVLNGCPNKTNLLAHFSKKVCSSPAAHSPSFISISPSSSVQSVRSFWILFTQCVNSSFSIDMHIYRKFTTGSQCWVSSLKMILLLPSLSDRARIRRAMRKRMYAFSGWGLQVVSKFLDNRSILCTLNYVLKTSSDPISFGKYLSI